MPAPPILPILTAPTAAGKTALALNLARQFGAEIVAADAFTVYRGLNIGTAKPTPEELASVPHHLIDVADVTEDFDVARYRTLAEAAIADILTRGRLPLIVGGTGFYLSALTRGLPLTPPADRAAQAPIEAELQARGLDALLAEIAAVNPAEAARMERNPRRVVRALEVYRQTGKFPGEFGYTTPAFTYRVFAFSPELSVLEERIRQRTGAMLGAGWPQEAQWLAAQVPPGHLPRPTVWQALGYAEALAVAQGTLSAGPAAGQIALATRQYAKRQLTWTRQQLGAAVQAPPQTSSDLERFLASATVC